MTARKIRSGKVVNEEGIKVKNSLDVDHSPVVAEIDYGKKVEYTTTENKKVIKVKVSNKAYGYAKKADVK